MSKKAFTLVEVIISMVIFAITMVGITNLLIYSKQQTGQSHSRMVQGELGRYFLDRLQMHVREDTWTQPEPSNLLALGNYMSLNNPDFAYATVNWLEEFDRQLNPNPASADDVMYYSAQEVTPVGATNLRRVRFIISYPPDVYE